MTPATGFVRATLAPALPPPTATRGPIHWIRHNLARSPIDLAMTVAAILFILWGLPKVVDWSLVQAAWTGSDRSVCTTVAQGGLRPDGWSGACWAFVVASGRQFMFGRYPSEELWRPIVVLAAAVALLVPMLTAKVGHKSLNALLLFVGLPIVSTVLLHGGLGLAPVETSLWGGLLVTLVLSFVGIAVSLPCGILLALGRRSELPVIRTLSIAFIEIVRGVPLITVLFMSSVMLPLFLPADTEFDKFLRALIGVSAFASAYMAEVVRGGLQAIPKGQGEGADSLGLSYWQKMRLVVMPQALRLVIPSIVNTFIGLFKDTSLVSIIGMFDLLGVVRQNFANPAWLTPVTPMTGLVFAGAVFWLFCFAMSRYSSHVERLIDAERR